MISIIYLICSLDETLLAYLAFHIADTEVLTFQTNYDSANCVELEAELTGSSNTNWLMPWALMTFEMEKTE